MPPKHTFSKPKKDKASKGQVIWCDLCGKVVKSGKCAPAPSRPAPPSLSPHAAVVKCEASECGIVVHKKCHAAASVTPCPHPSVVASSAAVFKRPIDACYAGCKTFVILCVKEIESARRLSPSVRAHLRRAH